MLSSVENDLAEAYSVGRKKNNSVESESLHETTMEEVKLGHLSGPFTETEMDRKLVKMDGFSTNGLLCTKGRLRTRKCVSSMTAGAVV